MGMSTGHNEEMLVSSSVLDREQVRMLHRAIDAVGVEERAAMLGKRSIKKETKVALLRRAIECMDLTTLEGSDTQGKLATLCRKAVRPDALDSSIPHVAAVCVYPSLVARAATTLAGTGVAVASVATAFPSGQSPLALRVEESKQAVADGADEVDMVINRGAFLRGEIELVMEEIAAVKEACGRAHLKVILETGELGSYDDVHTASMAAMVAGADFIKTSTGKIPVAATPPVALVMMEAIRDYYDLTGRKVGFKPAGGIKTAKQAIGYLIIANETLGAHWMVPELFRLGASTVLNDVLMQLAKEQSGAYQSDVYFTES